MINCACNLIRLHDPSVVLDQKLSGLWLNHGGGGIFFRSPMVISLRVGLYIYLKARARA